MAPAESGRPPFAERFAEGTEHFNSGRYWEAHESWESLWLVSLTEMRQFLQGLIQIAAAYLHLYRLNFAGAGRLFEAGLRRIDQSPDGCRCLLTGSFLAQARADHQGTLAALAEAGGHYQPAAPPHLELAHRWRSLVPTGRW